MSWIIDDDLTAARELTGEEALANYGDGFQVFAPMATASQPLIINGPVGQAVILFPGLEALGAFQGTLSKRFPTDDAGEFTLGQVMGIFDAAYLVEQDGPSWTYTLIHG